MSLINTPVPVGPEFRVNATVADKQLMSVTAALADGGYVAAWTCIGPLTYDANGNSVYSSDIYAQRYGALGEAIGEEFLVSSATAGRASDVSIAALPDGGFVACWMTENPSTFDTDVFARRYGNDDSVAGAAFRVNASAADRAYTPSIAALADGGFVVSWRGFDEAAGTADIFAQRYGAAGAAVGGEIRVNTAAGSHEEDPSVAALADGGFVVSWHGYGGTGDYDIFAQRYAEGGGAVGGEFRVNTTTASAQQAPSVSALKGGGFVVAWHSQHTPDTAPDIMAQRYTAAGIAAGGEFRVNATTYGGQFSPVAAALPDGGFLVVWSGLDGADGGQGIFAQRYTPGGTAAGAEFRIDSGTSEHRYYPSVAAFADERFVVTWTSVDANSDVEIYGRTFLAPPPEVEVRIARSVAAQAEGDYGPTPFAFTVSLSHAAGAERSVEWRVDQHGSHTAKPKDFIDGGLPSGLVVFAPGETEKTIVVDIVGDTAAEGDEAFAVMLRKPSEGLVIGAGGRADAVILNDDAPMLLNSAHEAEVARLYAAALDRLVDAEGFTFWVGALGRGEALTTLASGFLASAEFRGRMGDAADHGAFVDRLYRNILGRDGEAEGQAFWRDSLGKGCSRAEVLVGFSESAENVALTASAYRSGTDLVIG